MKCEEKEGVEARIGALVGQPAVALVESRRRKQSALEISEVSRPSLSLCQISIWPPALTHRAQ
jgi:hypothetical protein